MAEAQQEVLSESVATQLATKADLAELKSDVIKWMVVPQQGKPRPTIC